MKNNQLPALCLAASIAVTSVCLADVSIDKLVERADLAEGPVAVRELPRYRVPRRVLISDIGINVDGIAETFPDVEFIVVSNLAEAMLHVASVDAILGFCDERLFARAPQLVWVQNYQAGSERCLTVSDVANGNVLLTNMQKMSSPVIAEHAIALMMSLSRNLPQFAREMEQGAWARDSAHTAAMRPVAGQTLLVAGLGGIGTEVARLGAALDMRVIGTRNSSREGPDFVDYVGLSHELSDLVAQADVVVNALPLTESTVGVFDSDIFATIKKGAIFINVGRGRTVETAALLSALQSGHLAGAGLDVTDPEPLPKKHPLWQMSNVIITPHVASAGGERERHRLLLIENIRRYVAGERLLNVVDPERGY